MCEIGKMTREKRRVVSRLLKEARFCSRGPEVRVRFSFLKGLCLKNIDNKTSKNTYNYHFFTPEKLNKVLKTILWSNKIF